MFGLDVSEQAHVLGLVLLVLAMIIFACLSSLQFVCRMVRLGLSWSLLYCISHMPLVQMGLNLGDWVSEHYEDIQGLYISVVLCGPGCVRFAIINCLLQAQSQHGSAGIKEGR